MSWPRCDGFSDLVENQTEIAQHEVVREAQNGKPLALQPSIALRVTKPTCLGLVWFTVQLDDQPRGGTEEIGDVRRDRHLPPELEPVKASSAHLLPEDILGPRVGSPLLLGEGAQARIGFAVMPVVPRCL